MNSEKILAWRRRKLWCVFCISRSLLSTVGKKAEYEEGGSLHWHERIAVSFESSERTAAGRRAFVQERSQGDDPSRMHPRHPSVGAW